MKTSADFEIVTTTNTIPTLTNQIPTTIHANLTTIDVIQATTGTPMQCPENITVTLDHAALGMEVEWMLPTDHGYTKMLSYQPVGSHTSQFPLPGTTDICTFVITVKSKYATTGQSKAPKYYFLYMAEKLLPHVIDPRPKPLTWHLHGSSAIRNRSVSR